MKQELVEEAFDIIINKLSDIIRIEKYLNYLWLYRIDGDDMIGIIHGGIDKPFEFKVINVGDTKQQDFQFDEWEDFKYFLENELRSRILALAL